VRELAERYRVREVVFDPWRFGQAAQELERERVRVLAFPQNDQRMVPASVRLHAAIVEGRLTLPDDAELARHAANTIARHSGRGWRVDNANPRDNMDAIVALAMAVERAEQPPPQPAGSSGGSEALPRVRDADEGVALPGAHVPSRLDTSVAATARANPAPGRLPLPGVRATSHGGRPRPPAGRPGGWQPWQPLRARLGS
jgi:hypothetical protein